MNVDCSSVGRVHKTVQNRDNDATQPIENISGNVSLKKYLNFYLFVNVQWGCLSMLTVGIISALGST